MRNSLFAGVLMATTAVSCANAVSGPFGLPIDKIRGVNLGGWMLAEKWLVSSLYNGVNAEDEWTLQQQLGKTKAQQVMSNHWNTFVTEKEIKELVGYGVNFFRIPVGHWIVESTIDSDEPWVGGGYPYLVRALGWIRDAGAFAQIDLHGAPGAQNSQQTTGHQNYDQFWNGGLAGHNMQRALVWAANMTTLASTQFKGTVVSLEAVNEPDQPSSYPAYLKAFHDKVRSVEKSHGITCSGSDPGDASIKASATKRSLEKSEVAPVDRPMRLAKRCASHRRHKKSTTSKKQTVLKAGSVAVSSKKTTSKHRTIKKTKAIAHKKTTSKTKSTTKSATSSTGSASSAVAARYNQCLIIANMYNPGAVPSSKYANMANDIHQYQVFDDYSNSLDAGGHIQESCNYAQASEATNPAVIVGEWSLAVNNVDTSNSYMTTLAASQIWAFEHGAGWIFWNFKGPGVMWDFLGNVRSGIIKTPLSSMAKLATCTN